MDYRVYVDTEEGLTVPSFRLMLLLPLALAAVLLPSAARSAAKAATPLSVTVGPGFTIKVLDANNNSVVLKITKGSVSFLFTGDQEEKERDRLLSTDEDLVGAIVRFAGLRQQRRK